MKVNEDCTITVTRAELNALVAEAAREYAAPAPKEVTDVLKWAEAVKDMGDKLGPDMNKLLTYAGNLESAVRALHRSPYSDKAQQFISRPMMAAIRTFQDYSGELKYFQKYVALSWGDIK